MGKEIPRGPFWFRIGHPHLVGWWSFGFQFYHDSYVRLSFELDLLFISIECGWRRTHQLAGGE